MLHRAAQRKGLDLDARLGQVHQVRNGQRARVKSALVLGDHEAGCHQPRERFPHAAN